MIPRETANGWPSAMILSHIDDTTRAVTRRSRRSRRKSERRAWLSLVLIVATLAACIAWEALR